MSCLSGRNNDGQHFVIPKGVYWSFPSAILLVLGWRCEYKSSLGISFVVPFFLEIQSIYLNPSNCFSCLGQHGLFFVVVLSWKL